ncbi:activating signal cointegrator 1 complex subunit 1-like isoform X2 [Agrilus planipennis]|uniref:Activating signal cointegrator 1 complex subunit 1-like isoform X2 n=1 Tax=Agrilus planipennis TaxID=224129 RepID=A0A1W4XEL1_AGRPL|nr:activating signal cointegrator 1 complex subunit 1-like isoform X2 [Agrilus planipennis]
MYSTKPLRMWIDGKIFELKNYKKLTIIETLKNVLLKEDITEEHCSIFEITTEENGHFSTTFRLPTMYYINLHQQIGSNIKLLEIETKTTILIPKHGQKGKIKISSPETEGIATARHFIHSVLGTIREKHPAMQFISIPLRNSEISENFENFKNEILNNGAIEGIHESIFQDVKKLHLTVVVFALMDEHEKLEAVKALDDYKDQVLDPMVAEMGPLKIKLAGIDCMNNNLEKVNILYANAQVVDANEKKCLQKIANGISDHFHSLVRQYQENVKLHVTLMNTKYRQESSNPSTPKKKGRWYFRKQTFDARQIMEKYKDYYFGICDFDSIHLSLISSKGDDGFYKPLSIITV